MLNVNHHQIDDLLFLHYFIKTIRPLGPFSGYGTLKAYFLVLNVELH